MEFNESKVDDDVVPTDFKPGQKYPTPSPGNGDRVFYETLYQQKPTSEMAQEWVIAYGVLENDDALKLYTALCKKKGKPVALPSPPAKAKK